jgi:hypothetical protein
MRSTPLVKTSPSRPLRAAAKREAADPLRLAVDRARCRQTWTPEIRVLGPDGFEYHGWYGYLPPFEFIPRFLVGQGHAFLRQGRDLEAAEVLGDVVRRSPSSHSAAEAAYYRAASRYWYSHEAGDLLGWDQLRHR